MIVKYLVIGTVFCVFLKCSEVQSTEFIKNAVKNIADKVHSVVHIEKIHNLLHRRHHHHHQPGEDCKHHHHDHEEMHNNDDEALTTTTTYRPQIDIRFKTDIPESSTLSSDSQNIRRDLSESSTTSQPDLSPVNITLDTRILIDVPCSGNTKKVNGECKEVFG